MPTVFPLIGSTIGLSQSGSPKGDNFATRVINVKKRLVPKSISRNQPNDPTFFKLDRPYDQDAGIDRLKSGCDFEDFGVGEVMRRA